MQPPDDAHTLRAPGAPGPAGEDRRPRPPSDEICPRSPTEWSDWLAEHHTTASEVWIVFYKKASGKQTLDWAQAVETALRYGWIDGLLRGIDEERYRQRFTPRRPTSKWSKVNTEIALRLIAAGEMTERGLAAVEAARRSGEWERAYTVAPPAPLPPDLKEAVRRDPAAKANLERLSRTRRNRWLGWLEGTSGRTRARRLNMIVQALATKEFGRVDDAARKVR